MLKKLTATGVLALAVSGAAMSAAAPASAGGGPDTTSSGPTLIIPITALNCNSVQIVAILAGSTAHCEKK